MPSWTWASATAGSSTPETRSRMIQGAAIIPAATTAARIDSMAPRTTPAVRSASSRLVRSTASTITGTRTACSTPAANSSNRMFGTVLADW